MVIKKNASSILCSAALTVMLGLAMSAAAGEQKLTGAFDVGSAGNAQKFNPLTAPAGFSFYNKYFGTLALYDVGLQKIGGDLAQSWAYAKDGKSLTLHLRQDVKWHDGKPFTAADVKFTLELVKNPAMASVFSSRLKDVSAIRVLDAHTVLIELAQMDATLPDAFTSIMMLPSHLLSHIPAGELRSSNWWKAPVGTGPFKWTRYVPDQFVELAANPDFYRGKPMLAKLVNRYFKDASAASIALQAGEIQFSSMTLDQVRENQSTRAVDVIAGPSHVLNYIGFNNSDPRFKDVRVRQAILLAIDRKAIIRSIYNNTAILGNCVLTLPQYVPADINPYETSVSKARALLKAAGWHQTEALEMLTYYNDQASKDVVTVLQAMLAQVGISIRPRFVDGPTFGTLVDANKFSLVYAGGGNGPDPGTLIPLMQSSYAPPRGVNRMRVNLPELDQLFSAAQQETDDARRTALYQQMCRLTNAQLPWIPLWVGERFGGFARNVQNVIWTPSPGGGRYQDFPERWSIR
ncbi:ABC transporter substrate-binding protein [Duganella qianjiadongensis]|uniref:Peptide ABC transporter substrate-binding protein n=1 Tax=Duganella qianjiadongensis TaxID=2692176 RepID=A0ABW9VEQ2_9BURK|nr:ABC transporter substrate-binding protein [Duganella qianjiadongensis]MYM37938.1 peptide ABC transporter substrate-binding protein [Duganella qianjiadongensis]